MVRRFSGKNINKALIAGVGAGVLDGFLIQPLVNRLGLNISDDIARVGLGFLGSNFFRNNAIKNIFIAEATIGAFNLGKSISSGTGFAGFLGGGNGGNTNGGDF